MIVIVDKFDVGIFCYWRSLELVVVLDFAREITSRLLRWRGPSNRRKNGIDINISKLREK